MRGAGDRRFGVVSIKRVVRGGFVWMMTGRTSGLEVERCRGWCGRGGFERRLASEVGGLRVRAGFVVGRCVCVCVCMLENDGLVLVFWRLDSLPRSTWLQSFLVRADEVVCFFSDPTTVCLVNRILQPHEVC